MPVPVFRYFTISSSNLIVTVTIRNDHAVDLRAVIGNLEEEINEDEVNLKKEANRKIEVDLLIEIIRVDLVVVTEIEGKYLKFIIPKHFGSIHISY